MAAYHPATDRAAHPGRSPAVCDRAVSRTDREHPPSIRETRASAWERTKFFSPRLEIVCREPQRHGALAQRGDEAFLDRMEVETLRQIDEFVGIE